MDVTKSFKFIRFGVMDVTKPYKFIGFGAMDVTKPYKFIGFGAMNDSKGALRPSRCARVVHRNAQGPDPYTRAEGSPTSSTGSTWLR